MLGAVLGDIVGSRFEFDRGPYTKDFEFFTKECHFTDDTVMTLAVAQGLMDAGPDADEKTIKEHVTRSMQRYGRKYPNAGYGARFIHWIYADDPKQYNSFGNGSAMRVSSVGWLYPTLDRTLEVAKWTAEVSHNHIEGIKGAQCTAAVIYLGRTGRTKEEIACYVTKEFGYDFSESLDEMRRHHEHVETCMDSLPKALRSFMDGKDYKDTVRNAVSLGGDTDTVAAIAGAMAEGYYGRVDFLINGIILKLGSDLSGIYDSFCMKLDDLRKDPAIKEAEQYEREGNEEALFEWAYRHAVKGSSKEVLIKATDIYMDFIEKGDAQAMNNLGSMYYNGVHFEKDLKKAEEYYMMACEKGLSMAYGNLGCVYYYGDEDLRDDVKAYEAFSKGAYLFNDPECLMRLGDLYRYGRGIKKDERMAFHLYARALDAADGESRHKIAVADTRRRIGECFLYGIGVEEDAHEALFSFCVALPILYDRQISDPYAHLSIKKVNDGIAKAQEKLNGSN